MDKCVKYVCHGRLPSKHFLEVSEEFVYLSQGPIPFITSPSPKNYKGLVCLPHIKYGNVCCREMCSFLEAEAKEFEVFAENEDAVDSITANIRRLIIMQELQ